MIHLDIPSQKFQRHQSVRLLYDTVSLETIVDKVLKACAASARTTTQLETGQFHTEKSEQTPRQRARHEIETYVQDAELGDPRVQALADFSDLCSAQFPNRGRKELCSVDLIRETIRKRKNGMRGYLQVYNEVNELAGELHAAVFEETTDPDRIGNIDAQFAAELQEIKSNVILAKSLSP